MKRRWRRGRIKFVCGKCDHRKFNDTDREKYQCASCGWITHRSDLQKGRRQRI